MHVKSVPVIYIMSMYMLDFHVTSGSGSYSKHRNVFKNSEVFRWCFFLSEFTKLW